MQPVLIQTPPPSGKVDKYNCRISKLLGGLQVAVGVLSILLNIVGFTLGRSYNEFIAGHGIWAGAFFIVTGALGIGAGITRRKCQVISFMVLSIIAASLFVPIMVAVDSIMLNEYHYSRYTRESYGFEFRRNINPSAVGLHGTLLFCGVLELLLAVITAVFCCRAVCSCCGAPSQHQMPVRYIQSPIGTQQVMFVTQPAYSPTHGHVHSSSVPQCVPQLPEGVGANPPPYILQAGSLEQQASTQPGFDNDGSEDCTKLPL